MSSRSRGGVEERDFELMDTSSSFDDLSRIKRELEDIKKANPYRMAEMALEIEVEKIRVVELAKARDLALQRLAEAYIAMRQKNELIDSMQRDREAKGLPLYPDQLSSSNLGEVEELKAHIFTLEKTVDDLQASAEQQLNSSMMKLSDPPPCYEIAFKPDMADISVQAELDDSLTPEAVMGMALDVTEGRTKYIPPETDDPDVLVDARNALLSNIPLPPNPPDDTLKAIIIPPPFTLHELLNGASTSLRNSLGHYRILTSAATYWCPDREEHGYVYTPAYKCSTNPRIATAHRWNVVDVLGRMTKSTECFYNKDGVWYYAGSYRAFRLDDLHPKEWALLPAETTTAIVKDTLAGRKNTSPQNTYEASQLYAAGALKVACVGLQCVGFNQEVYQAVMEHSIKFNQAKWKSLPSGSPGALSISTSGGQSPLKPVLHPLLSPSGSTLRPALTARSPSVLGTPTLSPSLSIGSPLWNSCNSGMPWPTSTPKKTAAAAGDENAEPSNEQIKR